MKTYYYLYQITNLVNAKIYVGVHKTKNLDDSYMGSGKVISAAIQKHGIENFKKDILEFFDTSGAMYAKEKEIVTDEFLLREDTYNLRRGGTGGFDYINKTGLNISGHYKSYERRVAILLANQEFIRASGHHIKNYQQPGFKDANNQQRMRELAQTDSAKAKRKATMQANNHSQGIKNSQFGTMWITDRVSDKKIKKDADIPDGWNKGRIG